MLKIKKTILFLLICSFLGAPVFYIQAASDNTIEINSVEDLKSIADNPYGNYILMEDLSLKDTDWYPINFYGTFDGNGHTIYDLRSTQLNSESNITVDGNAKQYETYFSGLFGQIKDATIKNLNMKACDIRIDTEGNIFAACVAGYMENSLITNCNIQGYVSVTAKNIMCGVAGVAGFGYGTVSGCAVDVTLVFIDENPADKKCEEFMGGILATGYTDVEGCTVDIKGYSSIHGFAHNGGLVGMYYVHTDDTAHPGYVKNSSVNGFISFFENNTNRRAYCAAYVGEKLNHYVSISNNTNTFTRDERFDYSTILLPEVDENPEYTKSVTKPTTTEPGYTTYTCEKCGYSYIADYILPINIPSPFFAKENLEMCIWTESKIPINIDMEDYENLNFIWSSSDENVVVVDEKGNIKAESKGMAMINCSLEDGTPLGECLVNVYFPMWQIVFAGVFLVLVIIIIVVVAKKKLNKKRYYKGIR